MHPLFAFVDEYGDPSLETQKSGVTDHFVVVAVMVQPAERKSLDTAINSIRQKHFQTGERAGVPRSVAMKITGHKTEAVYRRYAIADQRSLEEGLEKLAVFRAAQNRHNQANA